MKVYASVEDISVKIDRVTLYRPPAADAEALPAIAALKPADFFVNPRAESDELIEQSKALGLNPVFSCSIVAIGVSPADLPG